MAGTTSRPPDLDFFDRDIAAEPILGKVLMMPSAQSIAVQRPVQLTFRVLTWRLLHHVTQLQKIAHSVFRSFTYWLRSLSIYIDHPWSRRGLEFYKQQRPSLGRRFRPDLELSPLSPKRITTMASHLTSGGFDCPWR
jgi:hypothetical protein